MDVHKSQTHICVLGHDGAVLKEQEVAGATARVVKRLREIRAEHGEMEVVFEAGNGMGFLHDQLSGFCRVKVAEPTRVWAMHLRKRKNDRVDALFLARLLQMDNVPEVWVPSYQVRQWRGLINDRCKALGGRTAAKNKIRSLLREQGLCGGRGLWTKAGRKWLEGLGLEDGLWRARLESHLIKYDQACQEVKRITSVLDGVSLKQAQVRLLMTIPGVGVRTAEAVVAYIDEVTRFKSTSSVGSYFGLVPSQRQSGSTNHLGRVTRQGPSVVRWLLVEAAWRAARLSARVGRLYARVLRGDRQRRKKAAVAVARQLAEAMVAMLRDGREWREESEAA